MVIKGVMDLKQGRFLKLMNRTPYDWIKTSGHSYDILSWSLPDRIKADTTASVYVEWEPAVTRYPDDNLGEASYRLNGTSDSFRVQVRGDGTAAILLVYCENLLTNRTGQGEVVPLDLSPDGCAVFILSGGQGNYSLEDVEETLYLQDSDSRFADSGVRKGLGLLEGGYNAENAYWEGETRYKTNIGKLHFPGDRKWENCRVEVRGTDRNQGFRIEIKADGAVIAREDFRLKQDEVRIIEKAVKKSCSLDITGQLKSVNSDMGGGNIYITCTFDPAERYQSQSVSWKAPAEGISGIDNLCLYARQLWEKCEIYVEGYENGRTGCMLTLISDGEIQNNGKMEWMELTGNQSGTFSFDIKKKVPLVVAGYISGLALTGAGAVITLTGFYK